MTEEIVYFRALNRPMYLIWRFTYDDIISMIGWSAIFLAPPLISERFSMNFGVVWACLVVAYNALIISVKPKGWTRHVARDIYTGTYYNPGHIPKTLIILEPGSALLVKKESFWRNLKAKIYKA